MRIVCDASHEGLGAIVMQDNDNEDEDWESISCASMYLTDYEQKYSTNELELLAIVWAVEHFRKYSYGVKFELISDHKALETASKRNHGNKSYSSRLTRWIDRLLSFDMEEVHQPGRTMGLADYLSRHPSKYNESEWSQSAKELWESWFVVNLVEEENRQLYANQRMNKLFNRTIELQQGSHARESGKQASRIDCESKHYKMSRLELGRERNATRHLLKSSKTLNEKQIVQSEDPTPKTSPLQPIISSVEASASSSAVNPEV